MWFAAVAVASASEEGITTCLRLFEFINLNLVSGGMDDTITTTTAAAVFSCALL